MDIFNLFLRVRFSEEKKSLRFSSLSTGTSERVIEQIIRALRKGIVVAGRHYKFLTFGDSPFRDHVAYFFSPIEGLSCDHIRAWMGDFTKITNVGEYCSLLGQGFLTSRAVRGLHPRLKFLEDVVNDKFNFTDGIGKISKNMASRIAAELNLPNAWEDPPSAFQIQIGGCKGMVAIDPHLPDLCIGLRPSQEKFSSGNRDLEVIRVSSFSAAALNRQLISILSTLGVPDQIFRSKMSSMVTKLDDATKDATTAVIMLQKNVDRNQISLQLAAMVINGFMGSNEPFTMSLLHLWKAWLFKYMKEKAKILIENGACLPGVTDESKTLGGHFEGQQSNAKRTAESISPSDGRKQAFGMKAARQDISRNLPEIFIQISGNKGNPRDRNFGKPCYRVIEGVCLLARNPSLHPGDIRVVRAVDVEALHHLKNVVVFPQNGDRDLASMCAGGDLDGDTYTILWDEDLIPREIYYPPVFEGSSADKMPGEKPEGELKGKGKENRKENRKEEVPTITIDDMRDFFVQYLRNERSNDTTYHSEKILGQLYDMVDMVDFTPNFALPFDKRILDAFPPNEDLIKALANIKEQYDAEIRRIMVNNGIKTELEVWSSFVLQHNSEGEDDTFAEKFAMIMSDVKGHYRLMIATMGDVGGVNAKPPLPIFAHAMYLLTARQVSAALQRRRWNENITPLTSFPWIFQDELGRLANQTEITTSTGEVVSRHTNLQLLEMEFRGVHLDF
ncbi:RdRP-domain-containing protein [Viridothelium virens]|uniref:RNA-dependent RNA polymerase n=1 Tax=Viridothelium virens TaxID=1048519 RepID=A0A6A6GTC9_VIRVR|nr:RdRP-domain-containing protein [Viridothelium virens]